ncbi:RNA recognition motif domain-containing protein [Dioscorea alata]|uniref:RNA recognition motif domain-containing protein n=1 Tax=Dioscorea alata TaxID=55571 RepID=A0ACB7U086_DIOAL|nr:RNA recognition motif domain-containing protein [Dioscorea alata]
MGTLDLTVRVLDISPKATVEDLTIFFSYCGSIEEIKLNWIGNESKMAYVTFKQPFAHQAALLLNDAVIVDKQVQIQLLKHFTSIPIK